MEKAVKDLEKKKRKVASEQEEGLGAGAVSSIRAQKHEKEDIGGEWRRKPWNI